MYQIIKEFGLYDHFYCGFWGLRYLGPLGILVLAKVVLFVRNLLHHFQHASQPKFPRPVLAALVPWVALWSWWRAHALVAAFLGGGQPRL